MLSLTRSCLTRRSVGLVLAQKTYVSRAHPKPIPEFPVPDALQSVLEDVERRRVLRQRKARRSIYWATAEKPARTLSHPSETIELVVNLNLDPRKPGQALRGSVSLPHGTGKKGMNCVVFTSDEEAAAASLAAGALHAGGEALVDRIVAGEIPLESFQAALATPEIMPALTKKAARLLGPRGLMPNVKVGTLLQTVPDLLAAVETQLAGKEVVFRTEKEGIVHVAVGKDSFGMDKLLDNIGAVMKTIFDAKPDSYGKGKTKKSGKKGQAKSTKQPKYLLRAGLSSTQGPGIRVDLRTVDPTSAFFLTRVDALQASQKGLALNAVPASESEGLALNAVPANESTGVAPNAVPANERMDAEW